MHIRLAYEADLDFLTTHDHHVSPAVLLELTRQNQVFLAIEEVGPCPTSESDCLQSPSEAQHRLCLGWAENPIGWMRWNLFWDNTPFLNMLYLLEPHRRQGHGRAMMAHWEWWMREQGFSRVLTSTQSDEEAQHFYRRLGYREWGALTLPGEPLEIIFGKELS